MLPKAREKVVDPFQKVHLNLSATATLGTDESGLYKKVASVESFIKGSQCMDYLSAKTKKVGVRLQSELQDQYRFLGNYPPTPPLIQQFSVSEK